MPSIGAFYTRPQAKMTIPYTCIQHGAPQMLEEAYRQQCPPTTMSSPLLASPSLDSIDSWRGSADASELNRMSLSSPDPGLLHPCTLSSSTPQISDNAPPSASQSPPQAAYTRSYHFEPATMANFQVRPKLCSVNTPSNTIVDDGLCRLRDVSSASIGPCWTKKRICSLQA